MIEMPPLQFAQTNGIRMGYYEAGPKTDAPPVILCHGWPEIAFSWRHQIKALAAAGIRVIAPDQRGYGSTDRPEPVESYDIEHLTGDLVGLLDHLKFDKAIFVGHDWGGFIVWQMPLRHIDRVAGVVGINTPHTNRAPADPIELLRKRFGEHMYIVQFQDPAREPDNPPYTSAVDGRPYPLGPQGKIADEEYDRLLTEWEQERYGKRADDEAIDPQ